MKIDEIKAQHRAKMAEARALHAKIKDDTPEAEARAIEREFGLLMGEVDELRDQIDAAKDAAAALGDPRAPRGADAAIRADGAHVNDPDAASFALTPEQRMTTWATARAADPYADLGLGRYLRSMAVGAKTDMERRALAEGTDSAGGYTVPTTLGARLIDALRAKAVCVQAGAQVVPLTSDAHSIAAVNADPTPGWRNENASVAESDPTFRTVPFTPRSLAVMTKVSAELLEDSLNLETALPQVLAAALATELDRVCLLGSGTAPEPRGIANIAGIGTTAHDDTLGAWAPLMTARTGILSANAGPVSAIILHPRDEGTLQGLADATGQPLAAPRVLESIPMLTTTAIPTNGGTGTNESTIFLGNFASLMIGLRSDVRILVSREYAMDKLQYTFLAYLRADVAAAYPAAFHTLTGVQG